VLIASNYWNERTNPEQDCAGNWMHKGNALHRWADLRAKGSDYVAAEEKYAAAVEAEERPLALAPKYIRALNNKGVALLSWSDLRAQRSDDMGAEEKYAAAVEAFECVLALIPRDIEVLNNKANALQGCGNSRRQRSDYAGAEEIQRGSGGV
jgi:tetratricopeptide (TPR) repeat protein